MLIDGVTCPGDAVCSLGFEGLEILGIQEVFQAVPGTATHVGAVEVRVQGHEPGAIVWPPQAGLSGAERERMTRLHPKPDLAGADTHDRAHGTGEMLPCQRLVSRSHTRIQNQNNSDPVCLIKTLNNASAVWRGNVPSEGAWSQTRPSSLC